MYPSPFFEEQAELKSQPILQNGGDPAMINQNYLFHIFVTKIRSSNKKNIEFQIWECFIYQSFKKILTIKQKDMLEVAVLYPELFWAYLVHVSGPGL